MFLVASTLYTTILISSSLTPYEPSSDALFRLLLPFFIPIPQLSGYCLHMQTLTSTQSDGDYLYILYHVLISFLFPFLSLVPGPKYSL